MSKFSIAPLSAYDAAALGVNTRGSRAAKGARSNPQGAGSDAPAVEISALFNYQSYFDNTLLQTALLAQPQNEPIVPSTLSDPVQQTGYALGLHPSSQAPVAVRFYTGGQQGGSQAFHLVPGQVIRPYGRPGEESGAFSGFRFGLPFGWLGGGSVSLVVLRTADAEVAWNNAPELIFHRTRMLIVAPASIPTVTAARRNWPSRFPWTQATYGISASQTVNQAGRPALAVTPTRTSLRLRTATLAAAAEMLAVFLGTNDFDLDSTGAVDTSAQTGESIVWSQWAQPVGAVNFTAIYQELMMTGALERFAADDGALVLVDNSGGSLAGLYVDVVRYGKL